jgi:hypothetical protein
MADLDTRVQNKDDQYKLSKDFSKLQKEGQYIYVSAKSAQELVIKVNKKIEQGYEPLGSPNINVFIAEQFGATGTGYAVKEGWSYMQFMLKTQKD